MAAGPDKARSIPNMLAGLLSCFRSSDGHKELAPHSATGHGRRDQAELLSSSKLRPLIACSGSSSGLVTAHDVVAGAGEASCKQNWTSSRTGTSSTSAATHAKKIESENGMSSPVCSLCAGPELRASCCNVGARLPAISTFPGAMRTTDVQGRTPTPAMLLSLRHLHMALPPVDYVQQQSPFSTDTPSGDARLTSVDFIGLGFGDSPTSASSGLISVSGLHPQLRFMNACKLGDEVQDLQVLGRGGYGMVMTGNWKQEGRVAVKVLLSDEDKWTESCYKEAVLSKMLAHPNILQTYDFQVSVLTAADVARAKLSWEQQQQIQSQAPDPLSSSATAPPFVDARVDSFELLPQLCAGQADAVGMPRAGGPPVSIDMWQVLFMLGARPGQYVTLIIMEYAEVGTLHRAIAAGAFRESARLSKWAALRSLLVTAKEIAGGMCLLHSYKIIHGDLSATNVMLRCSRIDKRGFVAKVADFGLSKVTLSGVARTEDWAGQAQYLAPECLDYEARLASDVFAFGVLLYELASGRRAFGEYQPAQILAGRLTGDLYLIWPSDAPPELRALAERCMLLDPEARPSFREVVDDLRRQDTEAKAQHRQHTLRRRYTADGLSAAALAAAGALCGAGRVPSPLGPHRVLAGGSVAAVAGGAGSIRTPSLANTPHDLNGSSVFSHAPIRHSFTAGSSCLVGGTSNGDGVAAAAAATDPGGGFMCAGLQGGSSRVLGCQSSSATSEEFTTAPRTSPALVACDGAPQLEPITSGVVHMMPERGAAGGQAVPEAAPAGCGAGP